MHALRRAHEALVPGGIVLDLYPFEGRPAVEAVTGVVGSIDSREFARDVRRMDAAVARMIRDGLFTLERQLELDVLEHFETAEALVEETSTWGRTRVPKTLVRNLGRAEPPFSVRVRLRLRRLRALAAQ